MKLTRRTYINKHVFGTDRFHFKQRGLTGETGPWLQILGGVAHLFLFLCIRYFGYLLLFVVCVYFPNLVFLLENIHLITAPIFVPLITLTHHYISIVILRFHANNLKIVLELLLYKCARWALRLFQVGRKRIIVIPYNLIFVSKFTG